jgi:hypothetical protein
MIARLLFQCRRWKKSGKELQMLLEFSPDHPTAIEQ